MADPPIDHNPDQPPTKPKPTVIGLYGVSGSGKSFLLSKLKEELGLQAFAFYDGSETIGNVVPGGLAAFQDMNEDDQMLWRQCAIEKIGKDCADTGRVGVVAGHFMFWSQDKEDAHPIYTQGDLDTFTHMIYLNVPANTIAERRENDMDKKRSSVSIAHLDTWQRAEKLELRNICRQSNILFSVLSVDAYHAQPLDKACELIRDFCHHNESYNLSQAKDMLDKALSLGQDKSETVLVMDADKTLAADDTSALFWGMVPRAQPQILRELFSGPMGYSYSAFRQAMLLYEEHTHELAFNNFCDRVASSVTIHPEFVSILRLVAKKQHVSAVVVTSGLRRIWVKVLEELDLSHVVKVIGGGRISDGYVVTPAVKGALVDHLRDVHGKYVWAFGDSPVDLSMMSNADRAIVVVGDEQTRSTTMDRKLTNAIANDGLIAHQVLLPNDVPPRLDITKLPLIDLMDEAFVDSIFCRRIGILHGRHATNKSSAKLLQTAMRDAANAGPALREAHRRAGQYLATEFLGDIIGLEDHEIQHVQGNKTAGHRLLHEQKTSIVALMRGGEPMAFGVSDAFPLAMFVHARDLEDLKFDKHLEGQEAVVLVDSVINSGKSILGFVQHIRKLHATIRIIVVAGVVQKESMSKGSLLEKLARDDKFSVVALRVSANKYTGKGGTDTGHRLFNTTHSD